MDFINKYRTVIAKIVVSPGRREKLLRKSLPGQRARVSKQIEWVRCPACHSKTRVKILDDTVLVNFPLFCPKCKQETLINIKQLHTTVIKWPDA